MGAVGPPPPRAMQRTCMAALLAMSPEPDALSSAAAPRSEAMPAATPEAPWGARLPSSEGRVDADSTSWMLLLKNPQIGP